MQEEDTTDLEQMTEEEAETRWDFHIACIVCKSSDRLSYIQHEGETICKVCRPDLFTVEED